MAAILASVGKFWAPWRDLRPGARAADRAGVERLADALVPWSNFSTFRATDAFGFCSRPSSTPARVPVEERARRGTWLVGAIEAPRIGPMVAARMVAKIVCFAFDVEEACV